MTSEKKKKANKQNAKKSTGPKSKRGKKNSSMNAVKHGLSAKTLLLPGENKKDFIALKNALRNEYNPKTSTEEVCFQEVVLSAWRLMRAAKTDPFMINGVMQEDKAGNRLSEGECLYRALVLSVSDGTMANCRGAFITGHVWAG